MTYEYKTMWGYHKDDSFVRDLNKLGKEGWRVIQSQMGFDKPSTAWESPKAKWFILMERQIQD